MYVLGYFLLNSKPVSLWSFASFKMFSFTKALDLAPSIYSCQPEPAWLCHHCRKLPDLNAESPLEHRLSNKSLFKIDNVQIEEGLAPSFCDVLGREEKTEWQGGLVILL